MKNCKSLSLFVMSICCLELKGALNPTLLPVSNPKLVLRTTNMTIYEGDLPHGKIRVYEEATGGIFAKETIGSLEVAINKQEAIAYYREIKSKLDELKSHAQEK